MAKWILSAFADEAATDLSDQLRILKEEGIGLIEMRGVNGRPCTSFTLEEIRDVRRQLDDAGIRLSALGSPFGKAPIDEPFDAHLSQFRHGLDICAELGCDQIRMFSFFIPKGSPAEIWRDEVIRRLDQMLTLAQKAGIRLIHENEKEIYGDTIDRCEDLLRVFEGRMGFVFDPANFIQCAQQPLEGYERLHSRITYMHIKDALFADGSVVPAGKGEGHVEDILRRLNASRDGEVLLTVEPHLSVFAGLQGLQAEEIHHKYVYSSNREAFHAACEALRGLLSAVEANP